MTSYTVRVIAVVRAAQRTAANSAADQGDTGSNGFPWTTPLRLSGDATNTVRAWWCNWALRPAQAQALAARLQGAGLASDEVRIVPASEKGSFVANPEARAYIFDARPGAWTPPEVLAATGLATLVSSAA